MQSQGINLVEKPADAVKAIAAGIADGRDLVGEPGCDGGIIVSQSIAEMAADMEVVAEEHFASTKEFYFALVEEMQKAEKDGASPVKAVRIWLNTFVT